MSILATSTATIKKGINLLMMESILGPISQTIVKEKFHQISIHSKTLWETRKYLLNHRICQDEEDHSGKEPLESLTMQTGHHSSFIRVSLAQPQEASTQTKAAVTPTSS